MKIYFILSSRGFYIYINAIKSLLYLCKDILTYYVYNPCHREVYLSIKKRKKFTKKEEFIFVKFSSLPIIIEVGLHGSIAPVRDINVEIINRGIKKFITSIYFLSVKRKII